MDARHAALTDALADRYRLERELGEGGMATVYLAEDLRHGRKVAVKVLREELSASIGQERFLREIRVAAALQHPHVLPLFDSGEAGGRLFYVMPFVDGESLRQRLAAVGELPVAEAVRILRDIADALSEAHRRGVVHRDLKPDNVMLRGRHALVTDFGVAKAVGESTGRQSLTTMGVALGTPTYMAPEQAVADPEVDHRADIYAFGVVAYELLTGQPPFAGNSPQATLAAHVTVAPVSIETRRTLPPALAALVMRCLQKRPADRWQTAEELVHALEAVATPTAGSTPAATVASPTAPPAARPARRVGAIVAGVLTVAVVAASAWWGTRSRASAAAAEPDATIDQVAVLPFENLGGDTGTVYLADGMTDEVANALAKVPGLKVASRTSSYAYRDARSRQLAEIGRTLAVRAVLEGTVSRAADQVRISARLTRTEDGVEIWSDAFVRPVRDVFAMQHDVGKAIVVALGRTLSGDAGVADSTPGTTDAEAYDLYLRAMHAWRQRDAASLSLATELLARALKRDPEFARAYAGLALVRFSQSERGIVGAEAIDSINVAARAAIVRDSTLSEPWQVLGFLYSRNLQLTASETAFRRALRLDPRAATAYQWFGFSMFTHERSLDSSVALLAEARRLDPLSAIISSNYATVLGAAGRWAEAQQAYRRAFELNPTDPNVLSNWVATLGSTGRFDELGPALDSLRMRSGRGTFTGLRWRAALSMKRGDTVGAKRLVDSMATTELSRLPAGRASLALAYASIGMGDRALLLLQASARQGPYLLPTARELDTSPAWASIRPLAGFAELRKRIVAYENAPVTLP